jgi:voltage-gated potassium channel
VAHHKLALGSIGAAIALAAIFGSLYAHFDHISEGHGLYWATQTVTTVGYGDFTPQSPLAYWLAEATMILAIPFWSAAFSLFTSWLVSDHVHTAKREMLEEIRANRPTE